MYLTKLLHFFKVGRQSKGGQPKERKSSIVFDNSQALVAEHSERVRTPQPQRRDVELCRLSERQNSGQRLQKDLELVAFEFGKEMERSCYA